MLVTVRLARNRVLKCLEEVVCVVEGLAERFCDVSAVGVVKVHAINVEFAGDVSACFAFILDDGGEALYGLCEVSTRVGTCVLTLKRSE